MIVSVSLPRLGGWRVESYEDSIPEDERFSLVAEIGWLASILWALSSVVGRQSFSLVAEIGWLASYS